MKIIEIAVGDKNLLTKAVEIAEFFLDSDETAFEPALTRAAESDALQAYQKADGDMNEYHLKVHLQQFPVSS